MKTTLRILGYGLVLGNVWIAVAPPYDWKNIFGLFVAYVLFCNLREHR